VLAAPVGSTVDLLNGDPLLHGVHGWTGPETAFNVPMAFEGQKQPQLLSRPGPIQVGCDVHGWDERVDPKIGSVKVPAAGAAKLELAYP
jgi:hypothetical protein